LARVALILVVLVASAAPAAVPMVLEGATATGVYRVALAPDVTTVPLREPHAWTLRVATAEGRRFFPDQLAIDGGMPGHGHGFSTEPAVTRLLENGAFLVEGMVFNMAGTWQLRVGVMGGGGWDVATFEFTIGADGVFTPGDGVPPDEAAPADDATWSARQQGVLRSLWLGSLAGVAEDPSNAMADDARAAAFGRALFFDPQLSASGRVACGSCHQIERLFTDGLSRAVGEGQTQRNTPDLVAVAERPWLYWDGRRDSLWAQALIPFEAAQEMGASRVGILQRLARNATYLRDYEACFGPLPSLAGLPAEAGPLGGPDLRAAWGSIPAPRQRQINMAISNVGKAIAAYERTIRPAAGRFDRYVEAVLQAGRHDENRLSADELAGLRLFLDADRTKCLRCHNGPLLTNQGFHNIGTGVFEGANLDFGRLFGLQAVLMDEFNCVGPYSDARDDECVQLGFVPRTHVPDTYAGAFKVPGLRNLAMTAPYFHDGRFTTLEQVVDHYRRPPQAALAAGEITPVDMNDTEARQLVAFLRTLDGGVTTNAH
jgi:cytochrome c peroxidase